jgi:hypothetical protein
MGEDLGGITIGHSSRGPSKVVLRLAGATNEAFSVRHDNGADVQTIYTADRELHRFFISNNEAMRIDSAGNVLIGTTTGTRHRINKNSASDGVLSVSNTSTTVGSQTLTLGLTTNGDSTGFFLRCADFGAVRLQIKGNGNVENVNNSYGAISDAKLKENVSDATPKLEKLKQVRVVNYNIIGDDQKQIGVIAQELEQIFPKMVEETPDRDEENNDLGTTTKSVKYSVFVPMLIKAIQEQQAIIEALEARITALEA